MKGIEKVNAESTKLINDFQDISFTKIGLIILCVWVSIYLIRKVLPFLADRGPSQLRLYFLSAVPIIRLILVTLAIIWILPIVFNITFENFFVIAGGASVAIGFAFKDLVNSLIAGIVAVVERPYKPGDWVKIDGDYGEVKSVGLRAISLVTASDDVVVVPHQKIWEQNISNSNNGANTLMCVTSFHLEPGHDARTVKLRLYDVALTSAYLSYEKPVKVVLDQTLHGTVYKIKVYPFDLRDQFELISDITVRTKDLLAELGIKEVSPAATAV